MRLKTKMWIASLFVAINGAAITLIILGCLNIITYKLNLSVAVGLLILVLSMIFLLTTPFASFSEFAKEVKDFLQWKELTRCPIGNYCDTPEKLQRSIADGSYYHSFYHVCQELIKTRRDWDASSRNYPDAKDSPAWKRRVATLEVGFDKWWEHFASREILPIDPDRRIPWSDRKAFLEDFARRQDAITHVQRDDTHVFA